MKLVSPETWFSRLLTRARLKTDLANVRESIKMLEQRAVELEVESLSIQGDVQNLKTEVEELWNRFRP
jgi:predicted nuclease with TOPRIM domain